MPHYSLPRFAVLGWVAFLLVGCENQSTDTNISSSQLGNVVCTVNYPLAYFAERIGGEHVDVRFPCPPGIDPSYWSPSQEAIAEFQSADLILLNGAKYTKWTNAVSLPTSRIIDTGREASGKLIEIANQLTHSHGPGGEHAHAGLAATTWLDPRIAKIQASAIHDALVALLPEHKQEFADNLTSLYDDLEQMDASLKATIGAGENVPVLFSHPVYQYLSAGYSMKGVELDWEPHLIPNENQLRELDAILAEHPAKWLIWEGQPKAETADLLLARQVQSVVFDPCGNRPAEGDYMAAMNRNLEALRKVYASDNP